MVQSSNFVQQLQLIILLSPNAMIKYDVYNVLLRKKAVMKDHLVNSKVMVHVQIASFRAQVAR